jgi:hypothetical protein
MFKNLVTALVVGAIVFGVASAAHACGKVSSRRAAGSHPCGTASTQVSSAPAATADAPAPAVAGRTSRSYRTYSYAPSSGGTRSSRSMMRGGASGVRDAASKNLGRYGGR